MKKYLLLVACSLTAMIGARGQEYRVKRSTGKLIVSLPAVVIEGYSGNEIVFSSKPKETEIDPKAVGLQTINTAGYLDNSGLGISVVEKGNTVEVNEVIENLDIKILVPKGMILSFVCNKVTAGAKVIFRNMDNEIEIDAYDNILLLDHVTGPLTARSLYGPIDVVFTGPVKGPVSIATIYGAIDVAIPVATKANMQLKSIHSPIMTSPDLKIEMEKHEPEPVGSHATSIAGKLNGGGTDLWLNSKFGKIYLRKTQ
ncbi:hypothetical protein D3H65_12200 [Paraflavitalea soli]|uniref:Uncharacterized protein n=1 Tax=Paraflavitalea soli TaxID=2315862 RepID=A0A3B7MLU1_9BACT|nr:hypothetical protein [Paraflavitalea soli]AXY74697.1 hypothetical protein D3H65_12200 [Paraflavitalea soli]